MIVSIVTPVLNGGYYFRECIGSVKAVTPSGISVEHLVVDGGSADGSVEFAEAHGLRVLREKETGLTGRMNIGYRAAQGVVGFE